MITNEPECREYTITFPFSCEDEACMYGFWCLCGLVSIFDDSN